MNIFVSFIYSKNNLHFCEISHHLSYIQTLMRAHYNVSLGVKREKNVVTEKKGFRNPSL